MDNHSFFGSMPDEIVHRIDEKCLPRNVVHNLAEAFKDTVAMSWKVFGQIFLNLSPGDIENIKEEKNRTFQILQMFQKWFELESEEISFRLINEKFDKAKLIATKQRFWNFYRDDHKKIIFQENLDNLKKFIHALVLRSISESEWTNLLTRLEILDKQPEINRENDHEKIRQRLNIILYWIEKNGYVNATISNLKKSLKESKLRRVICEITDAAHKSANVKFIHFLEDEWDYIFMRLNEQQTVEILKELKCTNIDSAFDVVMQNGNESFYNFLISLSKQCDGGDISNLLDSPEYVDLFNLHKISPLSPDFKETVAFRNLVSTFKEKKFVEIHGLPGSGKSQCASAFAKEFKKNHPLSIIWFLDCKTDESSEKSILSLRNKLLSAKVCENSTKKVDLLRCMSADIKKSDIYLLLVLEDVYSKIKHKSMLYQLLDLLKLNKKAFILAITRNSNSLPQFFHQQLISGFTDEEALEYLMKDVPFSDAEKAAAKDVIACYSNLPLGIAPAKAYRNAYSISYTEYLEAMTQEIDAMQLIEEYQNNWIKDNYKFGSESAGKNIFATMILVLSTFTKLTLSNRTVDFFEIFSYAMYFHHEKIPVNLFRQLILQPNLLDDNINSPTDLLCKMALNKMLDQLEQTSLGAVDHKKDFYTSTISTHKVVLLALKQMVKQKSRKVDRPLPKLLNALHALTCYFQKDNRLNYQHNLLITLMPHVSVALSNIETSNDKNPNNHTLFLEKLLVIKLLELNGFACTQADAPAVAVQPLQKAYDSLLQFICDYTDHKVENLDSMAQERLLEGNGTDGHTKAKARLLVRLCEKAVDKISPQVFSRLTLTVVMNMEDIQLVRRRLDKTVPLHDDIKVNQPLTADALEWLRKHELALDENMLKKIYLSEILASITYTRGRLIFYDDIVDDIDREEYISYLKLSYCITEEVFRSHGVKLLHMLLAKTNGQLYLQLDNPNKETCQMVYGEYKKYLETQTQYYEHGILKEDGKTAYNMMRCYKQMITANRKAMQLQDSVKEEKFFKVCKDLKQLVHDHPQYAKTAVKSLLVAGDFCKDCCRHQLAMEMYKEVMDRVNNEEELYQQSLYKATVGFCSCALITFGQEQTDETRRNLLEAKQRCVKAQLLVPRTKYLQDVEKIKKLKNEIMEKQPSLSRLDSELQITVQRNEEK